MACQSTGALPRRTVAESGDANGPVLCSGPPSVAFHLPSGYYNEQRVCEEVAGGISGIGFVTGRPRHYVAQLERRPMVALYLGVARCLEYSTVCVCWISHRGIAGPITSMLLVDNGADVTRIEPPEGDPFAVQSGYRVWHRGKRSARLDLHSDADRSVFFSLATQADIVLDSFSPGTMSGLGVDHTQLSARNPRLITCSITGYGEEGRDRDRPALDALVAARTGLLYDQKGRRGTAMEYILGRPGPLPEFDGPEGMVRGANRPGPVFPRTSWPSIGAAYLATLGIAAALRAREVTGTGQRVTTSLLQGALAAVTLNWQRVERPDAPLYWMWPLDAAVHRGHLRMRRRTLGAPLDAPTQLGPPGGGRGRPLAGRRRLLLPRRPRPGLDGG